MDVVSMRNAEHYKWGVGCDGWHLVKTLALSIIKERVPVGCEESRHYHRHAEQFFYVEAGVATLEIAGQTHQLEKGQGIHVPAGVVHSLKNRDRVDLVFVVTSVPPSHGDRWEMPRDTVEGAITHIK